MKQDSAKVVAIVGAGPVGLAAAAHAAERGMRPVVLEQGSHAGHAVSQWAHVPMFSHWALNIDAAAARRLASAGWTPPDPDGFPTGADLVARYIEPLARTFGASVRLDTRVTGLFRDGLDKSKDAGRDTARFLVEFEGPSGPGTLLADAVIDCSGTWSSPNPAGAGRQVPGEAGHHHVAYGMPDVRSAERTRYAGKRVAVLGGGHSAIGTLIDLASLTGSEATWLYRGADIAKAFGGQTLDQLAARGALGSEIAGLVAGGRVRLQSGFRVAMLQGTAPLTVTADDGRRIEVDELIVATGFRPDLTMLRELRVALDPSLECPPALAPLIDPNIHSCGTVPPHGAVELAHPEPGFWIAGMKSYGRAPTFLLATGNEQVRSIVAEIAGDHAAARRVELVLPETGVCSGPAPQARAQASGCCGTAAKVETVKAAAGCCGGAPASRADACCAQDEAAKDRGEAGCGCATQPAEAGAG
jgi:thioredoxin reductase